MKCFLIADLLRKAEIVKKTVEGSISDLILSSLVRNIKNSKIILDKDVASKLEINRQVTIVLGLSPMKKFIGLFI